VIEAVKALLLLGSVGVYLFVALFGRQAVSQNAGAVLAAGWIVVGGGVLGAAGILPSALSEAAAMPSLGGVPLALLITCAAAAGPLVVYAMPKISWVWRALAAWLVLLAISALDPGEGPLPPGSWITAALLLLLVAAPAHALATWTAENCRVGARSILQSLIWTALLLWIFPSLALAAEGRDWSFFLDRPAQQHVFWLTPLVLPAALIISALWQFAREGGGTGFPYDPPKRLVCHGIYAHISNPMQLGIVLLMAWWGVVLQSPVVLMSAPVAVLLFVVFSDVCSGVSNVAISDPGWRAYKSNVPAWRPRLSPWRAPREEISV
jgi:protein-S-isoprenylcysteine O-methyltransferase Ste14